MKKTYMTPATEVAHLQVETLIASSPLGFESVESGSTRLNETGATGAAMTKGYSVWEDDWSAGE